MFTGRGASVAGAHAGAVETVDFAVSLAEAMERLGRHVELRHISIRGAPSRSRAVTASRRSCSSRCFTQLPLRRPSVIPSARRAARASFVSIEIRLRSISATNLKAKQSTLLLMLSSKAYPSFVLKSRMSRRRHCSMIDMISVSVRLSRESSVTMSVSPRRRRLSRRPSLRLRLLFRPLAVSVTQRSTVRPCRSAKRPISSR